MRKKIRLLSTSPKSEVFPGFLPKISMAYSGLNVVNHGAEAWFLAIELEAIGHGRVESRCDLFTEPVTQEQDRALHTQDHRQQKGVLKKETKIK